MENIKNIVSRQKEFFESNQTKDIKFRLENLNRLYQGIQSYEKRILKALQLDLNKSEEEGYMTEIGMVLSEISFFRKNLRKLMKKKKVKTPLAQSIGKSYIVKEPYGVVAILSPWNYPIQLSFAPLVGSIAAGNCSIVKPSPDAPHSSKVIQDLISEYFDPSYIVVVEGGIDESNQLLETTLDYIFYTGSTSVGKIIMEKASHNLVPITLELGGKSPCLIHPSSDLKLAAKRIAFGKFLNAGQTCVAPDYVYVPKNRKDEFMEYLALYIKEFYGEVPLENQKYVKIINERHYHRLLSFMEDQKIYLGGKGNQNLQIEPTIIDHVLEDSILMKEEIFGPILPILTYDVFEEVVSRLKVKEKALALYLFTEDRRSIEYVQQHISFGGGCINDTIVHLASPYMGFGGVGASGMGSYHGKESFNTFSHNKSILWKSNKVDISMRYAPYHKNTMKLLKFFLK